MNQKYHLKNGSSRPGNQPIFQNISNIYDQWAYGKIKPALGHLLKENFSNNILDSLPENVLESFFTSIEQVYLESNEYIYQPEDHIRYLYFPVTAVVSEFQILEDGKTIEVVMTGREGLTGISSIFNSNPSPNWTQVSIAGKVLRLESKIFQKEFNRSSTLQNILFDYVNFYISQISQRVICNSHHTVEERLCCWLLMLRDRCKHTKLPLTQEQIARFLGVHRPSITLITQSLRERGVIDYLRGKIFILDTYKMEQLSCVCYNLNKSLFQKNC